MGRTAGSGSDAPFPDLGLFWMISCVSRETAIGLLPWTFEPEVERRKPGAGIQTMIRKPNLPRHYLDTHMG